MDVDERTETSGRERASHRLQLCISHSHEKISYAFSISASS